MATSGEEEEEEEGEGDRYSGLWMPILARAASIVCGVCVLLFSRCVREAEGWKKKKGLLKKEAGRGGYLLGGRTGLTLLCGWKNSNLLVVLIK